MTSQDFIDQLRTVQDALDANDTEAVAEAVIPLVEELESFDGEETRRHTVASREHLAGEDEDETVQESREFGMQKIRVGVFRHQIMLALLEYMSTSDPDPRTADEISDHIDELIGEEETFHETESEIGGRLDSQQQGPMLSIAQTDQPTPIEPGALESEIDVTVRNIGGGSGSATLVAVTDEDLTVPDPYRDIPTIDPGSEETVTVQFTAEDPLEDTIELYLVDGLNDEFSGLPSEEQETYIHRRAIDTFDHAVEAEPPEEMQAPQVIERGIRHRFTDPRDRKDYATIGATATGTFSAAGYAAYRQFLTEDEDTPDSESDDPDTEPSEETSQENHTDTPDE